MWPGDDLAPEARAVTTRAVEIAAPPTAVWPWLVQMGYGRGGWYAIDALERLLGVGEFATSGSATHVVAELQDLQLGDRVPLSEDLYVVVTHLDPERALVLTLPEGPLRWVWSFVLSPVRSERQRPGELERRDGVAVIGTRLVVRTRMGAAASWVRPLVPPLELGHAVMELVQLGRLRRRVELTSAAT